MFLWPGNNANLIIGGIILWNWSTACLYCYCRITVPRKDRSETKSILVDYRAGSVPFSVSPSPPSTKQNNLLGWSDLWRYQPTASRYCFPQRKFVKIRLTGTTSHLLQTLVINYEFNNHLSTMLRVINCLAWCLPVAIYFLARRSEHSAITLQTM